MNGMFAVVLVYKNLYTLSLLVDFQYLLHQISDADPDLYLTSNNPLML